MDTKHTPGPWGVAIGKRTSVVQLGVTGPAIAVCNYDNGKIERANARLIAAAPELLESLQGALTVLEGAAELRNGGLCDYIETRHGSMLKVVDVIATARAAISKAIGA